MGEHQETRATRWGAKTAEDPLLFHPDGSHRSEVEIEAILRTVAQKSGVELPPFGACVALDAALADVLQTESRWLLQAKADLLLRDPVDAVNDAEALLYYAQHRFEKMVMSHDAEGAESESRV